MLTVYKKDMHTYFTTFTGFLFIACVLLVGGIYCYLYNFYYRYATFETAINNLPFFFVFLIPVISAGVFTEEKKQKTEQLLYTLPITSRQIVLGKYLALLTILAIPMAVLGIYPLFMSIYGEVNLVQGYSNLLAVFLLGACLLAICMFISSLTDNMIVSAVICFATMFLLYQMDSLVEALTPSVKNSIIGFAIIAVLLLVFVWYMTKNIYIGIIPAAALVIILTLAKNASNQLVAGKINLVLSSMAVFSRLNNFMNGIFDVTAIVYYVAIAVLFVLFTVYAFERKRWV